MYAATPSIVLPISPPTTVASTACRSDNPRYAAATSTSSEMPRFVQRRNVSTTPSTRRRSGTGSIPHDGVPSVNCAPFAGTSRSRFDGCVLSRTACGTPVIRSVA
jgi:hypothetical protein